MSHYSGKPKSGSGRKPLDRNSKTVIIHVAVPEELLGQFDLRAFDLEKTRSQLIRDLMAIIVKGD